MTATGETPPDHRHHRPGGRRPWPYQRRQLRAIRRAAVVDRPAGAGRRGPGHLHHLLRPGRPHPGRRSARSSPSSPSAGDFTSVQFVLLAPGRHHRAARSTPGLDPGADRPGRPSWPAHQVTGHTRRPAGLLGRAHAAAGRDRRAPRSWWSPARSTARSTASATSPGSGCLGAWPRRLVAAALARRFTRPLVGGRGHHRADRRRRPRRHGCRSGPTRTPSSPSWPSRSTPWAANLVRARDQERQFLLSVSHELRTPLTSIRGYAEAVLDGATEDPVAAAARHQRRGPPPRAPGPGPARPGPARRRPVLPRPPDGRRRRVVAPGGRRVPAPGRRARARRSACAPGSDRPCPVRGRRRPARPGAWPTWSRTPPPSPAPGGGRRGGRRARAPCCGWTTTDPASPPTS